MEITEVTGMTIEKLLTEIKMSQTYSPKILGAYDSWIKADTPSLERARELMKEPVTFADPEKTIMLLMYIAVEERNHGAWARFPEDIFIRSMLVFTRSVEFAKEALGYESYTKGPWPLIHAGGKWFRLGELEFELNEENNTKEVHIHIPAGAKLTPEALGDTFEKERIFMREYLPDWADLTHACGSWMMSPKLKEMLPPESRILYFQSLFDVKEYTPTLRWVMEFVFKLEVFQQKDFPLEELREETSLQRAMKKYILNGGDPGEAYAVLNQERVDALITRCRNTYL